MTSRVESSFKPLGVKNVAFFGIERSRSKLDTRLKERTESMWRGGLLREAQKLMDLELPLDHPLWGAIGYSEASEFLRGRLVEAEAIERIFRRTRQYAKRQWTWFKHQHKVEWINLDEYETTDEVVEELKKRITTM